MIAVPIDYSADRDTQEMAHKNGSPLLGRLPSENDVNYSIAVLLYSVKSSADLQLLLVLSLISLSLPVRN